MFIKFERNVNHDADYRLKIPNVTIYFHSDNKWERHWKYWPGSGFNIGGTIFVRWDEYRNSSQCWSEDNRPFRRYRDGELDAEELLLRKIFGNPDDFLFFERGYELYMKIYDENNGLAIWKDLTIAQQDFIVSEFGKLYNKLVQVGERKQ